MIDDYPCHACGKKGKYCDTAKKDKCDKLRKWIYGEPQTNEEWLKSLDTESLVDYLFEVHKGGSSVERQFWIEEHKERIKMQFRGWLKEKHT